MRRTGVADLPLHYGKCPGWLFRKMVPLAESITEIIVEEYGTKELLEKLADPFWFQAFGNVLGFDWHSSGLTTTVCGALKEALNKSEMPVRVAGGKGKVSLKTPEEIEKMRRLLGMDEDRLNSLVFASRMSAKVDNAAVQDGYTLYHHIFVFDEKGRWAVIQQGMSNASHYARRYHWIHRLKHNTFVLEPHTGICAQRKEQKVLDLTSKNNREIQKACVDLVNEGSDKILKQISGLRKDVLSKCKAERKLVMPSDHFSIKLDKKAVDTLKKLEESKPTDFEELLGFGGVGLKTLRALALTSQLIYGTELSWKDPARFSFAHGGKDGVPYPVNKRRMEKTAEILKDAVENARIGRSEKIEALKRLAIWLET